MKKGFLKKAVLVSAGLFAVSGCGWDAHMAAWKSLGSPAHIQCWSGGVKIYDGWSTGKVENETQSDGFFFEDRKDGRLKDVSGNCVIDYGASQ